MPGCSVYERGGSCYIFDQSIEASRAAVTSLGVLYTIASETLFSASEAQVVTGDASILSGFLEEVVKAQISNNLSIQILPLTAKRVIFEFLPASVPVPKDLRIRSLHGAEKAARFVCSVPSTVVSGVLRQFGTVLRSIGVDGSDITQEKRVRLLVTEGPLQTIHVDPQSSIVFSAPADCKDKFASVEGKKFKCNGVNFGLSIRSVSKAFSFTNAVDLMASPASRILLHDSSSCDFAGVIDVSMHPALDELAVWVENITRFEDGRSGVISFVSEDILYSFTGRQHRSIPHELVPDEIHNLFHKGKP